MSVEVRQLKDKKTEQPFVPLTHWDAVSNKPFIPSVPRLQIKFEQMFYDDGSTSSVMFPEGNIDPDLPYTNQMLKVRSKTV